MSVAIHIRTTILPGNRIEVSAPELPQGQSASVFILVDEDASAPKKRLGEILADYPGGQLFRSADEVDTYLRAERESWDS